MQTETYEMIVDMMADKIQTLEIDAENHATMLSHWINRVNELQFEIFQLKKAKKNKITQSPNKRGRGRPKGSKNKVKK